MTFFQLLLDLRELLIQLEQPCKNDQYEVNCNWRHDEDDADAAYRACGLHLGHAVVAAHSKQCAKGCGAETTADFLTYAISRNVDSLRAYAGFPFAVLDRISQHAVDNAAERTETDAS